MTLPFAARLTLICALIFAILLTDISVATPITETNNSFTREKSNPLIGLPTLVVMGVSSFGRWLTPLDEWQSQIHKLNEDELFVQRWMLVNNDPASREKGKRAIMKIQKRRNAIEKKRNRFLWWYYPSMTVIGAGAMALTLWLQRD